mmetsp:Transcript_57081/g.105528  ORF Transcript_57081/g.105528 Transcript_57081/m.105528 type:complete len:221 (+) Transcript_57081:67-729(+)
MADDAIAEDPLAYLERKKQEVSAIQATAAAAQEQALLLMKAQQRIRDLEAVETTQVNADLQQASCLSPEDRQRFGLDSDHSSTWPLYQQGASTSASSSAAAAAVGSPYTRQQAPNPIPRANGEVPRWTSLSAEDRERFGLTGGAVADPRPQAAKPRLGSKDIKHHPDVLWDRDQHGAASQVAAPTMLRTLAQLEAVGATGHLAELQESERRLQELRLSGA